MGGRLKFNRPPTKPLVRGTFRGVGGRWGSNFRKLFPYLQILVQNVLEVSKTAKKRCKRPFSINF